MHQVDGGNTEQGIYRIAGRIGGIDDLGRFQLPIFARVEILIPDLPPIAIVSAFHDPAIGEKVDLWYVFQPPLVVIRNENRVEGIYLLGESAGLIAQALDGVAPMQMCADMSEAVELAWEEASNQAVVLLSPGCSSFDMFQSYADRGTQFAAAAQKVTAQDLAACNGGAK